MNTSRAIDREQQGARGQLGQNQAYSIYMFHMSCFKPQCSWCTRAVSGHGIMAVLFIGAAKDILCSSFICYALALRWHLRRVGPACERPHGQGMLCEAAPMHICHTCARPYPELSPTPVMQQLGPPCGALHMACPHLQPTPQPTPQQQHMCTWGWPMPSGHTCLRLTATAHTVELCAPCG